MRLPLNKWTHKGYGFLQFANKQNAYHPGFDFNWGVLANSDKGMPLFPFKSGEVVYTGYRDKGYGNLVVIKHDEDEFSKYGHLEDINCKKGDKVTTFTNIATLGESGTGSPHLHFEIPDKYIIDQGFRYYPVGESKEFVKNHYKNPLSHIMPTKVDVTVIADDTEWVQNHINWIEDWFLKHSKDQLKLNIEVKHVSVITKIRNNDVDLVWFMRNYHDDIFFKDIAIYTTNEEDWKIVEKGGYHKDNKIVGKELIFMHADEKRETRSFSDIKHEFKGRFVHEICHALYNSNGKEMHPEEPKKWHKGYDNTHYWDYTEKNIKKSLTEIDYDNLNLNPLTKQYMYKLVKIENDEDVYALKDNKLRHISTEETFRKGHEDGLWGEWGSWKEITKNEAEQYEVIWSFGLID